MRRFAFIAVLAAALGLTVPGAALAKSRHATRTHARHHARTRAHHKSSKARTIRLTPAGVAAGTSGMTGTTGTTTPTTPANPDSIGTVGSFDHTTGVLVLNLNDGSTVSGKVDPNATEFECVAPPSTTTSTASTRSDGGGTPEPGDGTTAPPPTSTPSGSDDQPAPFTQPSTTPTPESGDDNATETETETDDPSEDQPAVGCDSSLLVPGAAVREAELRISPSGGSTFHKLVLFH